MTVPFFRSDTSCGRGTNFPGLKSEPSKVWLICNSERSIKAGRQSCSGMTRTLRCVLEWPPCPCPGEQVPSQPGILIRGPTASNPGLGSSHQSTRREPWPSFPKASMHFVLKASQTGKRPGRPWVVVGVGGGQQFLLQASRGRCEDSTWGWPLCRGKTEAPATSGTWGLWISDPAPSPLFKKQDDF